MLYFLYSVLLLILGVVNGKGIDRIERTGAVNLDLYTYPMVINENTPYHVFLALYRKYDIGEHSIDSMLDDFFDFALEYQKHHYDVPILFAQTVINGAFNQYIGERYNYTSKVRGPSFVFIRPNNSDFIIYDS